MLNCKAIAILTGGQARRGKPPVAAAEVHFLRAPKIAARLPHSSVFTGLPAVGAPSRPVDLMLKRNLERLPVAGAAGRFYGMATWDSMRRTGFGGST